jgi:hypothetical protein
VHSCFIRVVASTPLLILVIASLVAPISFTGSGSKSEQSAAMLPTAALPPAIPAAEPVLLYNEQAPPQMSRRSKRFLALWASAMQLQTQPN